VSLWLIQSIFSRFLAPAHGGTKETAGHMLSAPPGLNGATITRIFRRAVREPPRRLARKLPTPRHHFLP